MDRTQVLKVLVPVGGLALLLLVVGVVVALSNRGGTTDSSAVTPPTGEHDLPPPPTPVAFTQFEKFPLDGPEWKDVGGGLKVWDVRVGKGAECPALIDAPNVTPVLHFSGWLTSGQHFDISHAPGQQVFTAVLKNMIDGWKKGVPGMKVGGTRRLIVPPEMGYGKMAKSMIPANSTLIFEIDLLDLK